MLPEWLWSIIVGIVVVGLVAALRNADHDRIEKLEKWVRDKEQRDYDWRHDEYNRDMSVAQLNIRTLETKMERVERVLNGRLKDER